MKPMQAQTHIMVDPILREVLRERTRDGYGTPNAQIRKLLGLPPAPIRPPGRPRTKHLRQKEMV